MSISCNPLNTYFLFIGFFKKMKFKQKFEIEK